MANAALISVVDGIREGRLVLGAEEELITDSAPHLKRFFMWINSLLG